MCWKKVALPAIVENALQLYAKKELVKQAVILKYAGSLGREDAESMVVSIQENKHNKEIFVGCGYPYLFSKRSSERS